MILKMTGVDYERATLSVRGVFAFDKENCQEALSNLMTDKGIDGALILSTCNRTELYVCLNNGDTDPAELLCRLKNVRKEDYGSALRTLTGEEVVDHVFRLSCGMLSNVFGEDQIITQVKNALFESREAGSTDFILEKLFTCSVTAAKKIKQKVRLTAVQESVVTRMTDILKEEYGTLRGLHCMVIGNGMIGRMSARALLAAGADVLMTVRNYKTREVEIPFGCRIIDYKERYSVMKDYDAVVSATTSPYLTVGEEEALPIFSDGKKRVLIDMAVPADISAGLSDLGNISLYDIDSLGGMHTGAENEGVRQALGMIEEYKEKYRQETGIRDYVDKVMSVSETGGEISRRRIEKSLREAVEQGDAEKALALSAEGSARTIASLLFDMKKILSQEEWHQVIDVFFKEMKVF